MLFIIDVMTMVLNAISVLVVAKPIHFVVNPFSVEHTAILPLVLANISNVVLSPVFSVARPICPHILALTLLTHFKVFAFKIRPIRPSLPTHAMLTIILPVTNVLGSIVILESAQTICLVAGPLAVI